MRFIPFQSLSYSSSLTLGQAQRELQELFDLGPLRSNEFGTWLLGELKEEKFRAVVRSGNTRNSFAPVIHGIFDPRSGGTRIRVRLRMRIPVLIFFGLIVGWLLLDPCLILITEGMHEIGISIFLIILALLIWSGVMAAYNSDARKVERILGRTFNAQAAESL